MSTKPVRNSISDDLPMQQPLAKRLAELTREYKAFGDVTPPPYNYRYDQIEKNGSNYKVYSTQWKISYLIPKRIASFYPPAEHRDHDELISNLDKYFEIKQKISDIFMEMVIGE